MNIPRVGTCELVSDENGMVAAGDGTQMAIDEATATYCRSPKVIRMEKYKSGKRNAVRLWIRLTNKEAKMMQREWERGGRPFSISGHIR